MSLSQFQESVEDGERWCAAVHGATKNQTWLRTEQQQLHNTHHCTEFYFNKHFILTKEDNEPEVF